MMLLGKQTPKSPSGIDKRNVHECGGKCTYVYVWLSLFAVHLKLSQYC